MTQIKFSNGKKDVTLNVQSIVGIDMGSKTLLRIAIPESQHTFEEVAELKKNAGTIEVYENETLKTEYYGFDLGVRGFLCNNENEMFTVDLTQRSSLDTRLSILEDTVEEIMGMLMDMD